MKKLLDRFNTLSDAIIAIIMTILVLEISAPYKAAELVNFFKEIILFMVSFVLLINIWYRRTKISLQMEVTKLESLLLDVFAHAMLALFPLAIKMLVVYENEWVVVIFFGLLNMLVITAINLIPIVELGRNWEIGKMTGWLRIFYWRRVLKTSLLQGSFIVLAYYLGSYGPYLYFLLPFIDFFANYRKDSQLDGLLKNVNLDLQSVIADKLGIKR